MDLRERQVGEALDEFLGGEAEPEHIEDDGAHRKPRPGDDGAAATDRLVQCHVRMHDARGFNRHSKPRFLVILHPRTLSAETHRQPEKG